MWASHGSRRYSGMSKPGAVDLRDVLEGVVHIASRLDSDRFEVVLEPTGAIVVRPSQAADLQSKQQEFGFFGTAITLQEKPTLPH
jgi:hypothetical protein